MPRSLLSCLLLAAACSAPSIAPAPAVLTLDHLYGDTALLRGGPSPAWTPDGRALWWIEEERVVRMDAATGDREIVFNLRRIPREPAREALQPRPIGRAGPRRVAWSPDSTTLLVHQGADLWLARDGEATRLTTTPEMILDPRWSPDGRHVSFVRGHDLWIVGRSGIERRLTRDGGTNVLNGVPDWVYAEEFGLSQASWWSPDGKRIGFLRLDQSRVPAFPLVDYRARPGRLQELRYPKAGDPNAEVRVGVATVDGELTWADLGTDGDIYVPRLSWLPDGRLLALRLNRAQTRLDVLEVDAATGATHVLFTETDDAWVEEPDDLAAVDGGFLWTSERDGWRHLYLWAGGSLSQVSRGEWDVERVVGVWGSIVYYESAEGTPHERHLWSLDLSTGERSRLTGRPGWHRSQLAPGGGALLDSWSTSISPARQEVLRPDGSTLRLLDLAPAVDLRAFRLPAAEFVTVRRDGLEFPAMLMRPAGPGPHPVLIHTYGGPGSQLVADRWSGNALWHGLLVQRGIAVFTLDNRGGAGRGRAWRKAVLKRLGELELEDQLRGVAWLREQPWVDAGRIAIWGWSYGGTMVCNALTASDVFRAGIAVAPVTDWRLYDTIYTERYMKRPEDNPDGYARTAPAARAATLHGELFLAHGLDDDNVHWQNTVVFADRLIAAGRPFELHVYPGKDHGIGGTAARRHLFGAMLAFLDRTLRPRR